MPSTPAATAKNSTGSASIAAIGTVKDFCSISPSSDRSLIHVISAARIRIAPEQRRCLLFYDTTKARG